MPLPLPLPDPGLAAGPILSRLLASSVELALLAILMGLLIPVARIRSPRVVCLLWLIVLLKPVLSLSFGSPLTVVRLEPATADTRDSMTTSAEPLSMQGDAPPAEWFAAPLRYAATGPEALAAPPPSVPALAPPIAIVTKADPALGEYEPPPAVSALPWIWLAGVLLMLIDYIAGRLCLRGILQTAQPAPATLADHYGRTAIRLGLRRPPQLLITDALDSPATAGLWRPVVLLPTWMVHQNDGPSIEWSLRHELTHWRWFDPWLVLIRDVVRAVFWFHPAAWWSARRLTESMELACDRAVLRNPREATDYAERLLAILQHVRYQRSIAISGSLFATRTLVVRRIAALLDESGLRLPPITRRAILGVIAAGVCVLSVGATVHDPTTQPTTIVKPDGSRVLHFPEDRHLGTLYVKDADTRREIKTFHYWIDGTRWEFLDVARGEVVVPPNRHVRLMLSIEGWRDLSPLARLAPDDLYEITFKLHLPGAPRPDDRCMPHLAHLTGLKELNLWQTDITDEGLRVVAGLKSLERLTLPDRVTNEGLAHVATLPALKALHFKKNEVTDAGLVHIEKLQTLEELELGGEKLTNRGLRNLKRLPSLRYLLLWGDSIDGRGLQHLGGMKSLRILHLGHFNLTDNDLAWVGRMRGLERLTLYDTDVTDAGLKHLQSLPALKMIDLSKSVNNPRFPLTNPGISDAGMVDLSAIRTLELVYLPNCSLTDAGLIRLAGLPHLRDLAIPIPTFRDAKDCPRYYTAKGLARLAEVGTLESLKIGGPGVTDEAMAYIAKIKNLKSLLIFGGQVTNEGLARLRELRKLDNLDLYVEGTTTAGISQLNGLPALREFTVHGFQTDGTTLNLGGLKNLEMFSMNAKGPLRDEDLACMSGLSRLRGLQVGGDNLFTDATLANVAGLAELDRLCLMGPGITDHGLTYLANLKKLNTLTLAGRFTDQCLRSLEGINDLNWVHLHSSEEISQAATERLRAALPNVQILNVESNRALPAAPVHAPKAGDVAPPFAAETLDKKTVTLQDFRGKVVLLYFWATWCAPCVAATPDIKSFQADLSKYPDFAMLSLSMDDDDHKVREHAKKFGLAWPQTRIGQHSTIAADYGARGAPHYALIDRDGRILSTDHDLMVLHATAERALKGKHGK